MKITEYEIIEAVIKEVRLIVNQFESVGREIVLNECVDKAIESVFERYRASWNDASLLRDVLISADQDIRKRCEPIVFEARKHYMTFGIRKTTVELVLDDFIQESGMDLTYKVRRNNSVGIAVRVPSTGQYLRFNTSYSKIISEKWRSKLQESIQEVFSACEHLGRIRTTANGEF